jgi:hypothetical protein
LLRQTAQIPVSFRYGTSKPQIHIRGSLPRIQIRRARLLVLRVCASNRQQISKTDASPKYGGTGLINPVKLDLR